MNYVNFLCILVIFVISGILWRDLGVFGPCLTQFQTDCARTQFQTCTARAKKRAMPGGPDGMSSSIRATCQLRTRILCPSAETSADVAAAPTA